jgi:hypothetical protein
MHGILKRFGIGLAIGLALLTSPAFAQTVLSLPVAITRSAVVEFGNGPLRFKALTGQGMIFTSSGSGISTAVSASTAMVLAASAAAIPPCVGCAISGAGITPGTTVTAFNGTTGVTLSAAMTVAASTPVAWGMACPATATAQSIKAALIGPNLDLPFYTYARLCGSAASGQPGAQILTSAVNTVQ